MNDHEGVLAKLSHVIHGRLLWFLMASYALAAVCAPDSGSVISRSASSRRSARARISVFPC